MTSKAQERKALEQIRKIVEGLGENSYIATAFEGCFEDAQDNIENDFAFSMKDRWECAEQKIEALKEELEHVKSAYNTIKKQRDNYAENLEATMRYANAEAERANKAAERADKAQEEVINNRKEVKVNGDLKPFKEVQFINYNGFRFVNVIEESGWTNSYKIDELEEFTIK